MLNNHSLQSVTKQCDPSSQTKQKIPLTQQNKCHTVCTYIASCIDDYVFELNSKSPGWRSQNGFRWCGIKITTLQGQCYLSNGREFSQAMCTIFFPMKTRTIVQLFNKQLLRDCYNLHSLSPKRQKLCLRIRPRSTVHREFQHYMALSEKTRRKDSKMN